jgi:hypothetical protein
MSSPVYTIISDGGERRMKLRLIPADETISGTALIPDDAIVKVSNGKGDFPAKAPVRLANIAEREITFDLLVLDEEAPALRDIIMSPRNPSPLYRYVNVWIISDDGGNGGLDEANFITRFVGVQKDVPDASGTVSAFDSQFTITLIPIMRHVIERTEPYRIARALNGTDSAWLGTPASETHNQVFDLVYKDSNGKWVILAHPDSDRESAAGNASVLHNGDGTYTARRMIMNKLADLFLELQLNWQNFYRVLLRDNTLTLGWVSGANPLNNLQFYKQSYNRDDSPGSNVPTSDIWYVGRVETRRYLVVNNAPVSDWVTIGGALMTDGGDGGAAHGWLAGYSNCWDLLGDLASTFGAKIVFGFDGLNAKMYWLAYRANTGSNVSVGPADFYEDEIEWELGASRVRAVAASIQGESGGLTKVTHSAANASENRDDGNIKCVFHNNCYTAANWTLFRHVSVVATDEQAAYAIGAPRENVLFYKESSPSWWMGGAVMVRLHHHVYINDGYTIHSTAFAQTMPDYIFTETNDVSWANHMIALRAYAVAAANNSGLPQRICYVTAQLLGFTTLAYRGQGLRETFPLEKLGDGYNLAPSVVSSYFTGKVQATCWLIDVAESEDDYNSFTLIALGAP